MFQINVVMGKGSNVQKAQRARADKLKKLNKAGNAGGGASGMATRKATAEIMANAKAEREEFRVRYKFYRLFAVCEMASVLLTNTRLEFGCSVDIHYFFSLNYPRIRFCFSDSLQLSCADDRFFLVLYNIISHFLG